MGKGTISPALAAQIRAQRAQQRTVRDFTPTTRRPMADDVIGRVGDFLHRNRSAADDETLDYFHTDPATVGDLRTLLAVAEAARAFIEADVSLMDRPQDARRIIARTTTLNKLHAAVAAMGEG